MRPERSSNTVATLEAEAAAALGCDTSCRARNTGMPPLRSQLTGHSAWQSNTRHTSSGQPASEAISVHNNVAQAKSVGSDVMEQERGSCEAAGQVNSQLRRGGCQVRGVREVCVLALYCVSGQLTLA